MAETLASQAQADLRSILPDEIMMIVMRQVGTKPTRGFLLNIARVCRGWHAMAQEIIDETVELVICKKYVHINMNVLQRMQTQTQLPAGLPRDEQQSRHNFKHLFIKDVHVQARDLDGQYFHENYEQAPYDYDVLVQRQIEAVAEVLSHSTIMTFTWAALTPMPEELAQRLANRQAPLAIHIQRDRRDIHTAAWSYHPVINLTTVGRMSSFASKIVTVEALLPWTSFRVQARILFDLSQMLVSCENLKELSLHCLARGVPEELAFVHANYILNTGSKRPVPFFALNGLMSATHERKLRLTKLSLEHFCPCGTQQTLADVIDLSCLKSLSVSCLRLVVPITDKLVSLDSFTLDISSRNLAIVRARRDGSPSCISAWSVQAVRDVIRRLPPLQELHIRYSAQVCWDADFLAEVGPTLRHLTSLTKSQPWEDQPGPTTAFIRLVAAKCPLLESLTCHRAADEEYKMPRPDDTFVLVKLRKLSLFYDEEIPHDRVVTLWTKLAARHPNLDLLSVTFKARQSWEEIEYDSQLTHSNEAETYSIQRVAPWGPSGECYHVVDSLHWQFRLAVEQEAPALDVSFWKRNYNRLIKAVEPVEVPPVVRGTRGYNIRTSLV